MNLLNFLGVGTVASTKNTDTDEIMVYLPSAFAAAEGLVQARTSHVQTKTVNASGEQVAADVMRSNVVPAIWKNMSDTNRMTSPDVREGSKVAIYQVSGQNQYYWTTHGINAETLRLETVMYGWSANPDTNENTPFNPDNFYIMSISTHDGMIQLRTSDSNNEKSRFDIQINARDGKIMIAGDKGNVLLWDDVERSFTYQNKDQSIVQVDKQKMLLYCKDQFALQADNKISIGTKEFNLQAETINIKANVMNVDVPTTNWTGNIKQDGNINQDGNTTSTGTIHADVDVTSKVSLNKHITSGVRGGNETSGPPVGGG